MSVWVHQSHLSPRRSFTGLSVKAWRGKRWWKDLARWGADTRVKPWRDNTSVKAMVLLLVWTCSTFKTAKRTTVVYFNLPSHIPQTLHSTGSSVYLAWHCGQKYPPRDSPAPLLQSRWLGNTHSRGSTMKIHFSTQWLLTVLATRFK